MNEIILNLAPYYDESLPLNIRMTGETICDDTIDVVRTKSELTALEFIDSGNGILEINGKRYEIKQNDVFFLKKGTNHHYYSSKENPWHKYWMIFEGPLAEMLIDTFLPEDTYVFTECECKKIINSMIKIFEEFSKDYNRLVDEITVELTRLFVYLKHRRGTKSAGLSDEIRKRLDSGVEQDFSLDEICDDLGYSKNYIIQVFEKNYGTTPYQYYIQQKIAVAKTYLQNTVLPINEVAERLSFRDQRYFSAWFKNYAGTTPTEYRNKTHQ